MKTLLQIQFHKYLIIFSLACIINPLFSQTINLNGTVKDEGANAVNGVNLTFKNKPTITATTNASGYFSLISSASRILNINDSETIKFDGWGNIYFTAANEPVRIDVYSVTGQIISTIVNENRLNGSFKMCAATKVPSNSNFYIVKVKVGDKLASNKFISINQNVSKGLQEIAQPATLKNLKAAALDTLILTHSSYKTKKLGINSYTGSLGNITLENLTITINAPGNLNATAASSSQINLSWNDYSNNEQGFRIERAPGGTSNYSEITTVGANVNSYQSTGLSASTSYTYRVRAYNGSSYSNYSNSTTATTSPLDYNFTGGTLSDLQAISPSLTFGTLTISGNLTLPSATSNVTLNVANLNVNANISTTWPTCSPYYNGPNLTINSTGSVAINSPINLNGMSGKDETSGSTCNNCTGPKGGTLTVNASTINVNNYIQTYGGNGARYYVGSGIYSGCSGGTAGNISLSATSSLSVTAAGADFDFYGGMGGYGAGGGANGTKGNDGTLSFSGPSITVSEIAGDLNMGKGNAQNIPYTKLTLNGTVFKGEETAHRSWSDALYITYTGGVVDYLEDLYIVYLPTAGTIKASLSASNALADLDLHILNYSATSIIGSSNGATSNESITTGILSAGKYIIAVSYGDDCANSVSTNYTLLLNN
jgi:hypothetical protein